MKTSRKYLPLSVIIRGGHDLKGLLRCIRSVDESVDIIASISQGAKFANLLEKEKVKIVFHPYGNWSTAAEIGIKAAKNNLLIIMDSDSIFAKGAIRLLYKALSSGNLIVQPRIEFLTTSSLVSKIISNSRCFENRIEPKAYSPGIGFRKKELIEKIGIEGCIYKSTVVYADDGNINKRARENNIKIFVEPKAIIYHDPVPLKHEIKTAYRLGIGNRQGQTISRGILYPIMKNFFTQNARQYLFSAFWQYGLGTVIFLVVWKMIYIYGYYSESLKIFTQAIKISKAP